MYKVCFNGDFHHVTIKNTQNRKNSATAISKLMLHTSPIPISKSRKRDLIGFCDKGTMPQFFDPFYEDLPCEMTAVDRLPVPDVDESSDDEEYDC